MVKNKEHNNIWWIFLCIFLIGFAVGGLAVGIKCDFQEEKLRENEGQCVKELYRYRIATRKASGTRWQHNLIVNEEGFVVFEITEKDLKKEILGDVWEVAGVNEDDGSIDPSVVLNDGWKKIWKQK